MSEQNYRIVAGGPEHGKAMVTLLPLLASFDIPARRAPEHLWHGDRDMIEGTAYRPQSRRVALDEHNGLLGFAFVTMREELLSHAPSAHLEVLIVGEHARRMNLGEALTSAAEAEAASRGAQTMTRMYSAITDAPARFTRNWVTTKNCFVASNTSTD